MNSEEDFVVAYAFPKELGWREIPEMCLPVLWELTI